ncbi:MAG: CoB-CoM heterodisulfide reductase HdrA2 [Nitrososphaeria archaeon]
MSGENVNEPRIGVFVCHCGSNIAGTVDVEAVTQFAATLPNVVYVKRNRYTCSDPGQEEIRKGIEEYKLNRVVVAACSPRMHEPTFRRCVGEAGLNPFLFEMANIREHCSWVHSGPGATEKAKEVVAMAVAKARYLHPLKTITVPVTRQALVIGGGIAGMNAALNLADMGIKVYVVEKRPTIGGHMAQLDKTFPTLDCSICIEGPVMVDVYRHPNIELISYAEVKEVAGFVGNFKVKVEKKPRYVLQDKCTGCGECATGGTETPGCPIEVPNEFDMQLGPRKAIYVPFGQAVPLVYTIDRDHCIECYKCVDACGARAAIDFEMKPEEIELNVGTIIVATGYEIYVPSEKNLFGYGQYDNVITALELERLINAAGPTGGEVVRMSDGKMPRRVAFIQCVGSRDVNLHEYCSGFCCMYALKNSVLMKQHHPETEIYIFFMDIRAPFKGFEEFYRRAREMGVTFIRGKPVEIREDLETKNLLLRAEDIDIGAPVEVEAEMVVLSTAAEPGPDAEKLARTLNITRGPDGFFLESHPKLKPIDTATEGIFLAGSAQAPKDIPYSVSQGTGAAARAGRILSRDVWDIEPIVAHVDPEKCRNPKAKCGICVTKCPFVAIQAPPGEAARVNEAMCHGCGTCVADCPHDAITQRHFTDQQIMEQVRAALAEKPEEKILGFLCNWCSYAGADLAGTSRFEYPPNVRIIRVMCSGRVDKDFVSEAFRLGAGMVIVTGCHPQDCHYISGNHRMKERMDIHARILNKLGISPERFQIHYFSAAEGGPFSQEMKKLTQTVTDLGVERIKAENEKARPILEKMLKRKVEAAAPVEAK